MATKDQNVKTKRNLRPQLNWRKERDHSDPWLEDKYQLPKWMRDQLNEVKGNGHKKAS